MVSRGHREDHSRTNMLKEEDFLYTCRSGGQELGSAGAICLRGLDGKGSVPRGGLLVFHAKPMLALPWSCTGYRNSPAPEAVPGYLCM